MVPLDVALENANWYSQWLAKNSFSLQINFVKKEMIEKIVFQIIIDGKDWNMPLLETSVFVLRFVTNLGQLMNG